MIKNYGFKLNAVKDERAYKLGGVELSKTVLRTNGQWTNYLPTDESQFTPSFDTYGCTIYGTENIQQILEKFHNGSTKEYDERYNYNLVKIVPPGADPHDAAQSFKNDGVISGELPMTATLEEYAKPRPMPSNLIAKGIAHPWELRHQWLWDSPVDKEKRTRLMKEYLQYSPLGVSVTAWQLSPDGTYIDDGQRNTHWTVCYGWNEKGWLIYDSYAPHRKVLSFGHKIEVCKRYQLIPSTRKQQLNVLSKLLQIALEWLGIIAKQELPTSPPITPPTPPQPQPTPTKPSLLIPWAKAIEVYEGANKSWNNPGAIRGADGKFLKFQTYEKGFNHLVDYLRRAATGKHKAYPKGGMTTLLEFQRIYSPVQDKNNPEKYCDFICKQLGTTRDTKLVDLL